MRECYHSNSSATKWCRRAPTRTEGGWVVQLRTQETRSLDATDNGIVSSTLFVYVFKAYLTVPFVDGDRLRFFRQSPKWDLPRTNFLPTVVLFGPPLWSSGQSFWLQIQRSGVRFPALPDFLSSSGSGTGSTQPREVNWGATWINKKK